MADTMISFNDNSLADTFLTENELRKRCPLAFRTEPTNPNLSDKYVHTTTIDVVNDMARLGWYPVEAKQCRPRKNSSEIRSFHMLSFQNPDVKILKDGEVDCYPRIILINSHDGFSSFKFMVGLFRLICSNGLVVADEQFANMSIRHINYTFDELRTLVTTAIKAVPEHVKLMNDMKNTVLSDTQKEQIAIDAMKIRKGLELTGQIDITKESIMEILEPIRKEDNGDDLWTIFNVIQEKMIKGQFMYSGDETKKARKQRAITSAKKDIDINVKLFSMANSYVNYAA